MFLLRIIFFSVFGDVLVVQPTFIFPPVSMNGSTIIEDQNKTEVDNVESRNSVDYYTGVSLVLYAAAAAALVNVVQIVVTRHKESDDDDVNRKVGRINSNHLMIASGMWNVILSVSSLPLLPNTLLSSPGSMSSVSVTMLLVSSVLTLLAVWSMVTAVSLTQHPTLVSMIRSTEICISLVTESLYWGHLPNYLSALGSLMVRILFP